jgi:hypothetical protein
LNAGVFGTFTSHYSNLRTKFTKPKLEGKLLQVLYVWHVGIYRGCIKPAWTAVGVQVKTPQDEQWPVAVKLSNITQLVLRNCSDTEDWQAMVDELSKH